MSEAQLVILWQAIEPTIGWIITVFAALAILMAPLPGRGPARRTHHAWRSFRYALRESVMHRAGGRCEASAILAWGRCPEPATEADHIYPWSKGGPTTFDNGQALCRSHNRRKRAITPPWWYVLGLERRRRSYAPKGQSIRVQA